MLFRFLGFAVSTLPGMMILFPLLYLSLKNKLRLVLNRFATALAFIVAWILAAIPGFLYGQTLYDQNPLMIGISPLISSIVTLGLFKLISSNTGTQEKRYNVVFTGIIEAAYDVVTVKINLARLFKIDIAQIEKYFIDKPVVIKKNIDGETAAKYQKTLQKAGAICYIESIKLLKKAQGAHQRTDRTKANKPKQEQLKSLKPPPLPKSIRN